MKTKRSSLVWIGLAASVFVALVWAVVLLRASTPMYYIVSNSMAPTLQIDDRILVSRHAYDVAAPKRGEVAVVKAPAAALLGSGSTGVDFVMRVVGEPGQTVEMVNGRLKVDGKWINEPSNFWKSGGRYDMKIVGGKVYSRDVYAHASRIWMLNGVFTAQQNTISNAPSEAVPAGQFLVLGDNRGNSNDSHMWGFASRQSFVGRVRSLFFPLNRRRSL